MTLDSRVKRLERSIKPTAGPAYLSFPTREAFDQAMASGEVPPRTKVYIGCTPDDWDAPKGAGCELRQAD